MAGSHEFMCAGYQTAIGEFGQVMSTRKELIGRRAGPAIAIFDRPMTALEARCQLKQFSAGKQAWVKFAAKILAHRRPLKIG